MINKKNILLTVLASAFFIVAYGQKTVQLGKASVDEVVATMTLEEKSDC